MEKDTGGLGRVCRPVMAPLARALTQLLDLQVAGAGAVVVADGLAGGAVVPLLLVGGRPGPARGVLDDGGVLTQPLETLE